MDAKSRRVSLSLAGWRRHSHSNTDTRNSYCDSNGYGNGYGYCYPNSNTWSQVHSHPEATPHAKTSSVSRDPLMIRGK